MHVLRNFRVFLGPDVTSPHRMNTAVPWPQYMSSSSHTKTAHAAVLPCVYHVSTTAKKLEGTSRGVDADPLLFLPLFLFRLSLLLHPCFTHSPPYTLLSFSP